MRLRIAMRASRDVSRFSAVIRSSACSSAGTARVLRRRHASARAAVITS